MTDPLSPGAQPFAACMSSSQPPANRDEPPRNPALPSWGGALAIGVSTLLAVVSVLPAFGPTVRTGKLASDANNLKQLWTMQASYMATFGARAGSKLMPPDTGPAFWTLLAKTSPPLIDASLGDIYDCPLSPTLGGVENCEYRGPASDVNACADGDPVGADIDGNHGPGEGGIVLRKSGDVMNYDAADPVWIAAAVRTR